jgi:hypothetical protein
MDVLVVNRLRAEGGQAEQNDRSLILQTAKPDRSPGISCQIEFRLIQLSKDQARRIASNIAKLK